MSSSDSDDGPVLRYGTPLEPYEDDDVPSKRKFQAGASEQHALDAHGRRRFHGAFTGGFTAGHGNSVSTPEGWTPTAFRSTRAERGAVKAHAPEDFMDEEDRSEFGIAPRLIQTQSDFAGHKRPHPGKPFHDGPIPGEPVLEQFVRAAPETAAVRLLRAMGWRPGQAVGERRARAAGKVYGCYVPPEFRQNTEVEAEDSDGSDLDYEDLFGPEDCEPCPLSRKDDQFGLGYTGLSRQSVLGALSGEYGASVSSISHLKMKDKGKKVSIRGQAFGVGALEEEDEDVYAGEDMSHYDFAIGGARADPPAKDKKKSEGLEGFVRAARAQPAPRVYPPPALPRDYTPSPAGFARARSEQAASAGSAHARQGLGRHELSADARGLLLGELPNLSQPPPSPATAGHGPFLGQMPNFSIPPPVLDTSEGRTIHPPTIQTFAASGKNTNFASADGGQNIVNTFSNANANTNFISTLQSPTNNPTVTDPARDETTEQGATEGPFRPFAGNPEKQARYERFVRGECAAGPESEVGRLAAWEAARELAEFQQAAKLYRPLTGVLRDRFTGASQADEATNPLARVERSARAGDVPAERREAAARGLHGALTRTRAEWRPHGLVCKRFNIPDPFSTRPDLKNVNKPKTSYSIFEYLEGSIHSKESFAKEQTQFSGSKSVAQQIPKISASTANSFTLPTLKNMSSLENVNDTAVVLPENKRMTVAELFLMEAEKERLENNKNDKGEVTQTIDKFNKIELYNSIFLSDSDNEDNDDGDKERSKSDTDFIETPMNIERNDSPPRGIFANLDFDQLNSWPSKTKSVEISQEKEKKTNKGSRWEKDVKIDAVSVGVKGTSKDKAPERNMTDEDDEVVELFVSATGGVAKAPQRSETPVKDNKCVDIEELFQSPKIKDDDIYGPKIPENLKKKIEWRASDPENTKMLGNASISATPYKELDIEEVLLTEATNAVDELPRPMFRDKNARQQKEDKVLEVSSSSDSDAWVDVNVAKSKKQKKKKKSKKHKHKSKHKKKER